MPTKKKRTKIIPDNLPANLDPVETCPSLFTGQKLYDDDPVKYGRVVQALGSGIPMTRIAKSEKLSPATVTAILKRESKTVDAVQATTAGLTSYASQACLERMIQKIEDDKMPPGVLPIAFGILRDKEKSDQGQATTIIEHKRTLTIEEVQADLARMRGKASEGEIIQEA